MNLFIFQQLHNQNLISDESLDKIQSHEKDKVVSLRLELKTLMYIGVLLLTTGLGIIVYENLDSIGHLAIVVFIALSTVSCFVFCIKKAPPFTLAKNNSNNLVHDYVLLLGCALLLILVAYLQSQFGLFGNRLGMATFIPMIILFITAYYFDHLAVLSLAIVNLAAWAGITTTPLHFLKDNDFSSSAIIFTGYTLGILLILVAYISTAKNIKSHFQFTYKNFGTHFLFISAIAAIIHFQDAVLLWFIPLVIITAYQFSEAIKEKSFYFFVITTLYAYIGISYIIVNALFRASRDGWDSIYIVLLYFIISAISLAVFLIKYNKQLKRNDSL
ncbi:MAG TPA: DUF2157 domain-containing protein [Segetibacter sp.]|jgi:branched-subunit amino acid transport protein AzlD